MFTRMQDNSNLRLSPKNTSAKGKNVFIQISTPLKNKTSAKKICFTTNFTHLIHKASHILSVFTHKCHCLPHHSQCLHLQSQLLKCHAYLKNQMMDKVPKERIVSVNFSGALVSLLDFLIPVVGIDRLYQSIGNDLTLYAA
jgi:hypothetical protein